MPTKSECLICLQVVTRRRTKYCRTCGEELNRRRARIFGQLKHTAHELALAEMMQEVDSRIKEALAQSAV